MIKYNKDATLVEYQEERMKEIQKGKDRGKKRNGRKRFLFLTDFPVTKRNVAKMDENDGE